MNKRKYIYICFLVMCSTSLVGCSSLTEFVNYTYKFGPRYALFGRTRQHQVADDTVKVVSYNIKHSRKIKEAVDLLQKEHGLANADIILLQEMTPEGVKNIADALNYNYVFYPAVHHPILKTGFGNAVVSKWPIIDDHKVILPAIKEGGRQRIAVGATLLINEEEVAVYSLHMGVFVNPLHRKKIVNALIKPIASSTEYCIVAGDFNTFTKKDREYVTDSFSESNFANATEDVGWTYKQWYFFNRKSELDHIFAKGLRRIDSGKINNKLPSDHLPVWAELAFN